MTHSFLLLGARGYCVLTASDGEQALQVLHGDTRPCVILLDLMMPHMNAWEFRAAQASEPEIADIPVVAISGDANPEPKAAQLGAAAWLAKPVPLAVLMETLERFRASWEAMNNSAHGPIVYRSS